MRQTADRITSRKFVATSALIIAGVWVSISLATAVWEPVALWLVGHSDALPIPRSADSR